MGKKLYIRNSDNRSQSITVTGTYSAQHDCFLCRPEKEHRNFSEWLKMKGHKAAERGKYMMHDDSNVVAQVAGKTMSELENNLTKLFTAFMNQSVSEQKKIAIWLETATSQRTRSRHYSEIDRKHKGPVHELVISYRVCWLVQMAADQYVTLSSYMDNSIQRPELIPYKARYSNYQTFNSAVLIDYTEAAEVMLQNAVEQLDALSDRLEEFFRQDPLVILAAAEKTKLLQPADL